MLFCLPKFNRGHKAENAQHIFLSTLGIYLVIRFQMMGSVVFSESVLKSKTTKNASSENIGYRFALKRDAVPR